MHHVYATKLYILTFNVCMHQCLQHNLEFIRIWKIKTKKQHKKTFSKDHDQIELGTQSYGYSYPKLHASLEKTEVLRETIFGWLQSIIATLADIMWKRNTRNNFVNCISTRWGIFITAYSMVTPSTYSMFCKKEHKYPICDCNHKDSALRNKKVLQQN